MNIQNNQITPYQNFTARSAEIRLADDIARAVNREFPRLSPSNFEDFPHRTKKYRYEKAVDCTWGKLLDLRNKLADFLEDFCEPIEHIDFLPTLVKDFKIGNCGESATLGCIAAKVNKIRHFGLADVWTKTNDLDHSVIIVKNGKKPYVIDPWLGFADYLPNAIQRYKNEFRYHFDLSNSHEEKIIFVQKQNPLLSLIHNVSSDRLRKKYPNLVVHRRTNE